MCVLYEVDPDGDLLIILPLTNGAFALWIDSDEPEALPDSLESGCGVGGIGSSGAADEGSLVDSCTSPSALHLKVSSKHLILASRHFKKMLTGDWAEAEIHQDGHRHVTLESFDPSALKILLDIIHGKTRKVPRSLDLETLAKVSVLVDDLGCHEEVEIFVDIWLNDLPSAPPSEYNRDLILWILISSVFHKTALFNAVTRTAILHSTGPIQTLELPVRSIIVEKIDHQRQELLDQLIKILHDLFDRLREGQPICSFECDSILLGALVKQAHPHRLIWPRPVKPFTGFDFAKTAGALRRFQSPSWSTGTGNEPEVEPQASSFRTKKKGRIQRNVWGVEEVLECPQHRCRLQDLLIPQIDRLEDSVNGLDLKGDIGV